MVNVYFAVQLARIYATLGYLLGNCCDPSSPVPPPVRAFFLIAHRVYSSQVISTGQHFLLLLSLILTSEKVCANSRSLARIARSPATSSTRKRLLGGHDITLRKIRTGNIALKFTGRICAYSKGPRRLCARGKYFPPDWWRSPSFRVCAQFSSCAN